MSDLNRRVMKLEKTVGKSRVPESERHVVVYEGSDAQAAIEKKLQALRSRFGEDVSAEDLFVIHVQYEDSRHLNTL